MAFDAGFLAAVAEEINRVATGARVEKVYLPERDTVVLQMRTFEGGKRLLINGGSANPRVGFTGMNFENPQNPPMFCMLLRKHLSGAKLLRAEQIGFERVLKITFEVRDEMGYLCGRRLFCEVMGKYSNLVFTDDNEKILGVLRPVDFSTSTKRQLLPGMRYELPPPQDKENPIAVDGERFLSLLSAAPAERPADKWVVSAFLGISATVAREIVFRTAGRTDMPLADLPRETFAKVFLSVFSDIRAGKFAPSLVRGDDGTPAEYAFLPLTQYREYQRFDSASELLDIWFGARDQAARVHQRASDLLHLVSHAKSRITRKLELQRAELAECANGETYKHMGELIVSNCYALEKGMTSAMLTDYGDCREDGTFGTVCVELDARLTPAANAQHYFKKYTKSKNAKVELTRQIAIGEAELAYLAGVETAMDTAETPTDLAEIREELFRSGYASRGKAQMGSRKITVPAYAEYRTSGGYRVLCGKNNLQNEYITHKLAGRGDIWFHAKNMPGSHVVLLLEGKEEPAAADFTEAASIAALFSAAAGAPMTEVDYTEVRNLKKTPGGKPGFVIYHQNWSATVSPDREKIAAMRVK